jgi:hypothetical protein
MNLPALKGEVLDSTANKKRSLSTAFLLSSTTAVNGDTEGQEVV